MLVLDENIIEPQVERLKKKRLRGKQIGKGLGKAGMTDKDIIPLLLKLPRPTLISRDRDYWEPKLCHQKYCLIWLDCWPSEVEVFCPRILPHPLFKTKAQRLGKVIRVAASGIWYWQVNGNREIHLDWDE